LPPWAGGRLDGRVRAVVLGPEHAAAYRELVGLRPEAPVLWAPGVEPDAFAVGLFLDSHLVGTGSCYRQWNRLGIDAFFFAGDLVTVRLRGRGLSRVLHQSRLREAARRGILEVFAVVFAANPASAAGYAAVGFHEIHRSAWQHGIERHFREVGARADQVLIFGRST
jgi:L-amino acid N-acyltransferase YncA